MADGMDPDVDSTTKSFAEFSLKPKTTASGTVAEGTQADQQSLKLIDEKLHDELVRLVSPPPESGDNGADSDNLAAYRVLESKMKEDVIMRPPNRHNYLLIDPEILNAGIGGDRLLQIEAFVRSIFYVGKGTNRYRYTNHFTVPNSSWTKGDRVGTELGDKQAKYKRILETWNKGSPQAANPVQILKIFNGIRDEEALTREAIMIKTITTGNLTNEKLEAQCLPENWPDDELRRLGSFLLYKAFEKYQSLESEDDDLIENWAPGVKPHRGWQPGKPRKPSPGNQE